MSIDYIVRNLICGDADCYGRIPERKTASHQPPFTGSYPTSRTRLPSVRSSKLVLLFFNPWLMSGLMRNGGSVDVFFACYVFSFVKSCCYSIE